MAKKRTNRTPTTAAAWRKPREEGFNITLLSGNVATLRPVALDVLVQNGQLPDMLTAIAAQMLWEAKDPEDIAGAADVAKGYAQLINAIIPAAFLYPKVVDGEPQGDDEISLEDIEFGDKIQVFNLATAGALALRKFRDKQEAGVESVPDGDGDAHEAE